MYKPLTQFEVDQKILANKLLNKPMAINPFTIKKDIAQRKHTKEFEQQKFAEHMIDFWGGVRIIDGASGKEDHGYLGLYNLHMHGVRRLKGLGCESVLEVGSGLGQFLVAANKEGLTAHGIDSNPHLKKYFDDKNPDLVDHYRLVEVKDFVFGNNYDAIYTIETLEHVSDDDLRKFLIAARPRVKYVYFSSIPPEEEEKRLQTETGKAMDYVQGHINIKTPIQWIEFFELHGFKFVQDEPDVATWGMLFK